MNVAKEFADHRLQLLFLCIKEKYKVHYRPTMLHIAGDLLSSISFDKESEVSSLKGEFMKLSKVLVKDLYLPTFSKIMAIIEMSNANDIVKFNSRYKDDYIIECNLVMQALIQSAANRTNEEGRDILELCRLTGNKDLESYIARLLTGKKKLIALNTNNAQHNQIADEVNLR